MGMTKRRAASGFTLMELLIVVIIIGILATLALPQFTKFVDQSREAEALNIASAVLTAEYSYFQENGEFTDDITKLSVEIPVMKFWEPPALTTPGGVKVDAQVEMFGKNHGHANSNQHKIKGLITNTGAKTLSHDRNKGVYTEFFKP